MLWNLHNHIGVHHEVPRRRRFALNAAWEKTDQWGRREDYFCIVSWCDGLRAQVECYPQGSEAGEYNAEREG